MIHPPVVSCSPHKTILPLVAPTAQRSHNETCNVLDESRDRERTSHQPIRAHSLDYRKLSSIDYMSMLAYVRKSCGDSLLQMKHDRSSSTGALAHRLAERLVG